VAELAAHLDVSRPSVHSRLHTLTDSGLLRVGALVDAVEVDDLTVALVGLTFRDFDMENKLRQIVALEQVSWAAVVTGLYDIVCEVVTTGGMAGLHDFINEGLKSLGAVRSTEGFIIMKWRNQGSTVPPGAPLRAPSLTAPSRVLSGGNQGHGAA
jgi:DNA-binding Lrp family transcriptional regulator